MTCRRQRFPYQECGECWHWRKFYFRIRFQPSEKFYASGFPLQGSSRQRGGVCRGILKSDGSYPAFFWFLKLNGYYLPEEVRLMTRQFRRFQFHFHLRSSNQTFQEKPSGRIVQLQLREHREFPTYLFHRNNVSAGFETLL